VLRHVIRRQFRDKLCTSTTVHVNFVDVVLDYVFVFREIITYHRTAFSFWYFVLTYSETRVASKRRINP